MGTLREWHDHSCSADTGARQTGKHAHVHISTVAVAQGMGSLNPTNSWNKL